MSKIPPLKNRRLGKNLMYIKLGHFLQQHHSYNGAVFAN